MLEDGYAKLFDELTLYQGGNDQPALKHNRKHEAEIIHHHGQERYFDGPAVKKYRRTAAGHALIADALYYGLEQRWRQHAFWERRNVADAY